MLPPVTKYLQFNNSAKNNSEQINMAQSIQVIHIVFTLRKINILNKLDANIIQLSVELSNLSNQNNLNLSDVE